MFTYFSNYLASGNLSGVLQFALFTLFVKQSRGPPRNLRSLHLLPNSQGVSQLALFALFVKQSEGLAICALCTFCSLSTVCQRARGYCSLRSLHFLLNRQRVLQFALSVKQSEGLAVCALCTFCETVSGSCSLRFLSFLQAASNGHGMK